LLQELRKQRAILVFGDSSPESNETIGVIREMMRMVGNSRFVMSCYVINGTKPLLPECKAVFYHYNVTKVPAVVIFENNTTIILTGAKEINEKLLKYV